MRSVSHRHGFRTAPTLAIASACMIAHAASASDARSAPKDEPRVTFLNAGELAPGYPIEEHADWVFGGISSIDRMPIPRRDGIILFLPDDRGAHGPPRVGVGTTGFGRGEDEGPPRLSLGTFAWHLLPSPAGEPFARDTADPEGVRVLTGGPNPSPTRLVWTSEGYVRGGVNPGVFVWDMNEPTSRALDVPEAYLPAFDDAGEQTRGITHNRGFESVATLSDGSFLVAPENPPVQDERDGMPRLLRVTRYVDLEPAETLWYPMRPTLPDANPRKHGVSEMLALDDTRLLVIERSLDADDVQHAWLVEADLTTPAGVPMRTRVVFDFRTIEDQLPGGVVPNVEAMTLGPVAGVPAHPGRRALLVVSDNDFDEDTPTVWISLDLGG